MSAGFRAKLRLGERLLTLLSRPDVPDTGYALRQGQDLSGALSILEEKIPRFPGRIQGKAVVDFGCGSGVQAVALARAGAARVLGIDVHAPALAQARSLARAHGVEDRVRFVEAARAEDVGQYDAVISQNAMEHFPDPAQILDAMRSLVRPGGELLITFGPPWFAPYGSHMYYFTAVPWVNLLFSEETVMNVRSRFRDDGARSYTEVPQGLNKMSLEKFEQLVGQSGGRVRYRRYDAIRGVRGLSRIPYVRELVTTHVTCVLQVQDRR